MIGFSAPYTFTQFRTASNYSAIAIRHAFQFTVAHALGVSAFTSRILATDWSVSHCNLETHVRCSCQSNSFLAISSQSPSTAISRSRTNSLRLLFCTPLLCFYYFCPAEYFFCMDPKHNIVFCCQECVFTAPLPSKRHSIVPRVRFCGNVFTDPLPSNGYTRHNFGPYHVYNGYFYQFLYSTDKKLLAPEIKVASTCQLTKHWGPECALSFHAPYMPSMFGA
jgi:hypothetical protein